LLLLDQVEENFTAGLDLGTITTVIQEAGVTEEEEDETKW
jgi:hypothetical protein